MDVIKKDLIIHTARNLRRESTGAETIFWEAVRNKKIEGKKFLRQHPIKFWHNGLKRFFMADFYCRSARLVVELDGGIHEQQKDYDELRTNLIATMGLQVVRFSNEEVENNLEYVLEKIRGITHPRPLAAPSLILERGIEGES